MSDHKKLVMATRLATEFRCVGSTCADTCCAGWLIEVDKVTQQKYQKKRDLIHASELCGEDEYAMCCDKPGGTCLQHHQGWCTIQQRYGEDFLNDTCFFYPRTFRRLGSQGMMGASLSCPEATRMALYEESMFSRSPHYLPRELKLAVDFLPEDLAEDMALMLHQRILASLEDASLSAEQHMMRLIHLCYALHEAEYADWDTLTHSHLQAPALPFPERDTYDALRILHDLLNIAIADGSQYRPRLYQTIRDMEKALDAPLHWIEATLDYTPESLQAAQAVAASWQVHGQKFNQVLRNWIAAYVSNKVFPFGGLGDNPREEAFLFSIHFATVKLALMCACHRENLPIASDEAVRIVQSIARLYDHITEARIFFNAYDYSGWQSEKGLQGLIAW